jgi:integrase
VASIRKRTRAKEDVWIVDYRDSAGVRRWMTCRTRREAEDVRAEKVTESRQAASPVTGDREITLATYADQWLAQVSQNLRPQTLQSYRQLLRLYILPALGRIKVRRLHRAAIKNVLTAMRGNGLSKNTVRLARATLSVVLADAIEDGLIGFNPAKGLGGKQRRRPDSMTTDERRQRIRPFTKEQVVRFMAAAVRFETRFALYFFTLVRAGLRPGEGLGLQWPDLDFLTRELHVERTLSAGRIEAPKTGESRTVDMSAQLTHVVRKLHVMRKAETLKRGWVEVPPWAFCSEAGTPFDLSNAQKALKRTLKKAGLPVTHTLYDLRHTFAILLLADGAPLTYVAAQLGHAKATTTLQWYAHWLPRSDKRWVDALDARSTGTSGSQTVANVVAKTRSGGPGVPEPPDLNGEP